MTSIKKTVEVLTLSFFLLLISIYIKKRKTQQWAETNNGKNRLQHVCMRVVIENKDMLEERNGGGGSLFQRVGKA